MSLVDLLTNYLYLLRYLVVLLMVLLLVFALDDVFIDLYYWVRHWSRHLRFYRNKQKFDEQQLFHLKELPIAIMVPAWQEVGVVGKMAEFAAAELDYENYQIFVGTYPNDPATQADVDAACARFPHVHKVVCARPGPTSKADCLNNVITSILDFERKTQVKFAGFVLHDAEDVVSAMELRLFNYLLPKKDLIQLPVYPFVKGPFDFTSGHYMDEFSESHGKDVIVREALVGQVPSAGVGTCFSRRAILKLSEHGDGLPFDVQSLTEDYDIGFRLKHWGMTEIFVRFPVTDSKLARHAETSRSRSPSQGNVVCVREYFPETFHTAVRQKSRWIIGIVFQGFKTHRWTNNWRLNYFLWRDRKGVITYFVSFISTLIFAQLCLFWFYDQLVPDGYRFLSIFVDDPLVQTLLGVNFIFFANRLLQRMIFVRRYYGIAQALLSVPRQLWGNVINFFANVRAWRQVLQHGDPRRVAWDKTQHEYPSVSESRANRSLGSILTGSGLLTERQIETALEQRQKAERLGQTLLRLELVSPEELGRAVALQLDLPYAGVNPFTLPEAVIALLPARLALKYMVLPLSLENGMLHLVRESQLSPVALGQIQRQTGFKVQLSICAYGAVSLGIRHWYRHEQGLNPDDYLRACLQTKQIDARELELLQQRYFACQLSFGDSLIQAAILDPAVVNQVLISYDHQSGQRLGDYLLSEGIVSADSLAKVVELQRERRCSIQQLTTRLCHDKKHYKDALLWC
ncbi:phage adsorption protein NrfB [Rheinheimera sediminis]|uniref:glycosyl transferase family protein n=1 Tax=Rheinheimera sp. YQF-1 TaxID=2499626 RepID=UPI000FD70DFF|nr:glycosyl transferase family protein [Rheinheimera sp. YQF-1]RVT44846.1 phage adsorption protein NrfB [Rheinheimera sp. YQF-1]